MILLNADHEWNTNPTMVLNYIHDACDLMTFLTFFRNYNIQET